jgi:TetR/AcrR family transcriptional repressor of nem operon
MGRTSDAKERLIDTARELMHAKGYGAVGVGEICTQAGVNKGSFYYFFESKQRLGLAAIDAYTEAGGALWREIADSEGPALDRLERIVASAHQNCKAQKSDSKQVHGCMLGNLALEQSTQDPEIQARIKKAFDGHLRLFERLLREAIKEGALAKNTDAKDKARAAVALMEGSMMLAKVQNDPKLTRDLPKQVIALVRA